MIACGTFHVNRFSPMVQMDLKKANEIKYWKILIYSSQMTAPSLKCSLISLTLQVTHQTWWYWLPSSMLEGVWFPSSILRDHMALTPNMNNEVANHQDSHHPFYTYNASQPLESPYNWIVHGENLIELCSFFYFYF